MHCCSMYSLMAQYHGQWPSLLIAMLVSGHTENRRDHCLLDLWAWEVEAHLAFKPITRQMPNTGFITNRWFFDQSPHFTALVKALKET